MPPALKRSGVKSVARPMAPWAMSRAAVRTAGENRYVWSTRRVKPKRELISSSVSA